MTKRIASDCAIPWPSGGREGDELLAVLGQGELSLAGMMPWSSNYTFLGEVALGERREHVIYKPSRGERPLWDFQRGSLARREVAAFVVCRGLRWDLVPPTVLRNGPHGKGSVQLFVEVDEQDHYFTFRDDPDYRHALQALALFDIITNNADRKGGHCLRTAGGCVVAIDQGLCFHADPKLRTVIWDFAGESIPADLASDLSRLHSELETKAGDTHEALAALIAPVEIGSLANRIRQTLDVGCFPNPPEDRRPYPWPLV